MPGDISTTNTWLSLIAIASVIQVLALAAAVFVLARFLKRANAVVDSIERQVQPVVARTNR